MARSPSKRQTYPKCLSEDKRLGFKFDVQKESSEGSSLMKKAEWIKEKKSFFCHYRKLSYSWKEAYLMLFQKSKWKETIKEMSFFHCTFTSCISYWKEQKIPTI
ncbi:hypothetical protein HMPREF9505_01612 [Enterococcus faecalis TX0109]|nr:hypothetical protein HMPREF9505_01612 [Enterococcus faecalis TX0109]